MKQVLLFLLGLYFTNADEDFLGGDSHDLVDHEVPDEVDAETEGDNTDINMLGGDLDDNGCIASAGYTWCDELNKCLRPFEEDCTATVVTDNTETDAEDQDDVLPPILGPETTTDDDETLFGGDEDYMNHGGNMLGGERDENGCLGSAGYTWCEKQSNCVRSWELEGEWDDECVTETTSSDSSGESSSESFEDEIEEFFYNSDGTIKPWVFQCFLGLSITAAILLICLIRVRRRRKRRRRRRRSSGVMLAERKDNYERFNSDADFVFQETVAVKNATKDAVPSRKEFINLV